jgi:hypothetical protein
MVGIKPFATDGSLAKLTAIRRAPSRVRSFGWLSPQQLTANRSCHPPSRMQEAQLPLGTDRIGFAGDTDRGLISAKAPRQLGFRMQV